MEDVKKLSDLELEQELLGLGEDDNTDPATVLQELRVHQIELEQQNRELRAAQAALESSRDRYAELYDFAPVGYLTLDPAGLIVEANLTAAQLLRRERGRLIGSPLAGLLAAGASSALHRHLRAVIAGVPARICLTLHPAGSQPIEAELECGHDPGLPGNLIRCALLDVTARVNAERALQQGLEGERLLSSIATHFLETSPEHIDHHLQNGLAALAHHLGADCAGLLESRDGARLRVTHWWGSEGSRGNPARAELPADPEQWWLRRLQGGEPLCLPGPGPARGDAAAERGLLRQLGCHSLLLAPCMSSGGLIGALRFERREGGGNWSDTDAAIRLTGTAAALFGDALERCEAARKAARLGIENRALAQRLIGLQEEERRQLARDIHDELGQWTTAIQAEAEAARRATEGRNPAAWQSALAIARSAGRIQEALASLMDRLRPGLLDELGLQDALTEHLDQWRRTHPSIRCEMRAEGRLGELREVERLTVYRIVQESLNNVARHSGARRVDIELQGPPGDAAGTLRLLIQDDGAGLPPANGGGHGLIGMRERALAAGGTLTVASAPGTGVAVRLSLPVAPAGQGDHDD